MPQSTPNWSSLGPKYPLPKKCHYCLIDSIPHTPFETKYRWGFKKNLGQSKGGEIIQNQVSSLVVAFFNYYSFATNIEEKCKALLDGLKLCARKAILKIIVKLKSLILVQMIKKRICKLWKLKKWWSKFKKLLSHIWILCHNYKEGN